jgi:anaerobic magnesium-protoporphyrin IX monomethyl ester cyclase
MKIGLIFPNKNKKDRTVHLGLGYLASYARKDHTDLEFRLLDTRISGNKETEVFFDTRFDMIGITVLSPVFHEAVAIANRIKVLHPGTVICVGGPYVTTMKEEILEVASFDYAVYGEGEKTFSEFISYLKSSKSIEEINGLIYRKKSQVILNPPREFISDLDEIPMPAYDLFQMNRYPMHRIASSRGCPFRCSFCNSSSIWSWKWRKRSAIKVVEEIEFLVKKYKKKTFFFNDNCFNIDLDRVEKICDLLTEKNLEILWSTPLRAELINENIATKMKAAGCYNVGIGIESANNSILEQTGKNACIEDMEKGIEIFQKAGIEVLGQFVIGNPGDTFDTVSESLEWANNSNLNFIKFYSALPFKGTHLWEFATKQGKLYSEKIHEYHNTFPRIVFETEEFNHSDRLRAIALARKSGYYSDSNDKSLLFDFGKGMAKSFQGILPSSLGNAFYLMLKRTYKKFKKN